MKEVILMYAVKYVFNHIQSSRLFRDKQAFEDWKMGLEIFNINISILEEGYI